MMLMKRRDFLKAGAAAGAMASLYGCAGGGKASGHVVVVGGGYGGATVAKYLRMWSEGGVQVTLIERNPTFISCPISNLVIGGTKTMEDITISYEGLRSKWGVRVIQDDVVAVDAGQEDRVAQGRQRAELRPPGAVAGCRFHVGRDPRPEECRSARARSCTPGRPARRRSPCASSWKA